MISFETHIKPIFADYNGCMKNQTVVTDAGAYLGNLEDYETVKKIHAEILFAIDTAWKDGQRVANQAMPPRGKQLSAEDISKYKQWIEDGMLP